MYNVYILVTEKLMTMFENKETKTTKTETSDYQTYNIYLYTHSEQFFKGAGLSWKFSDYNDLLKLKSSVLRYSKDMGFYITNI